MSPSNDAPTSPFAKLLAAHRRIEAQLARFDSLAGRADAAEVVRGVLDFFAGEGARHHDDEERHLFPRLRALPAFAMMIPALEAQHEMMDSAHQELRAELDRGCPGGPAKLKALAARFAEMHRGHIIAEEKGLFPMVETALPAPAKAELARELEERVA